MKNTLLLTLFSILLFSCEPPDDDPILEEDTQVYLEVSVAELFEINNTSITPIDFIEQTNETINTIDANGLNGNLESFRTRIAVPIDETVSIDQDLLSVIIILDDGTEVPPFFQNSQPGSVIVFPDDVVERQEFIFSFTYPTDANPIEISSIQSIVLKYQFVYNRRSDGTSLHTKVFDHIAIFQ